MGNHVIEDELGVGGMLHATLSTLHALKVLDPRFRGMSEVRGRFLAEVAHLDCERATGRCFLRAQLMVVDRDMILSYCLE